MTYRVRIQTRRSITIPPATYDLLKRASAVRGIAMSALIDQALGDLTGPRVAASVARALVEVRPKAGRQRKAIVERDIKPANVSPAVAKPKPRLPSLERRYLGDGTANALGFR